MKEIEKKVKGYKDALKKLQLQNVSNGSKAINEIEDLEKKLSEYKVQVYSTLTPWQRVQICRHSDRPRSCDFIKNICDEFTEIHGDRLFRDDEAIIGGFGYINGKKFVIIAQEKGKDTQSRLKHNFGMPHPEGYRKALRLMELAEKFHLPVLTIIDTPGAYCGLAAEERGQGWAIAKNLWAMARLKTPIINVLIGEGCSGGALGIGIGDVFGMLEHAYYSVISPEGCASILWKDAKQNKIAAEKLKMHAEDLLKWEVIDEIIAEPLGGAHHDVEATYASVKEFILEKIEPLMQMEIEVLLEARYQKFRKLGVCENLSELAVVSES